MLGPYSIKFQGDSGHQNVSKFRPDHSGDKGKQLKTSLSYMGQNVKKKYIFGYLRGPGGPSMISI